MDSKKRSSNGRWFGWGASGIGPARKPNPTRVRPGHADATLTGVAGRVLVKEVNWLGDLVLSLPALRAIRAAFATSTLTVLVKKELAGFFDGMTWIDEVMPYTVAREACVELPTGFRLSTAISRAA